jgi:pimeloyl-ACP methyl ester carboxylesterase
MKQMMFESFFANRDGVSIHYLDSRNDSSLTPLLICPGLSETAEEYTELMAYLWPRRCVVLSFRGRGLSSTPSTGYDLQDHVSDIERVVESASLERFHLFSYSRGVSYALGYAKTNSDLISSVIVQDYPAQHKQMPPEWADEYINDYLIPYERTGNIRPEAVRGIQRESRQMDLRTPLHVRLLVLRGLLEGSLVGDDDVEIYKTMSPASEIIGFQFSDHDIRGVEKSLLFETIKNFLEE